MAELIWSESEIVEQVLMDDQRFEVEPKERTSRKRKKAKTIRT